MQEIRSTYRYVNQFTEVFSCLFMHGYYTTRICNELQLRPTVGCQQLLKDLQMVFKSTAGGFSLASNTGKDYTNRIFRNEFHLNFEFTFSNPYFSLFTSLHPDPEARYYLKDDFREVVVVDEQSVTDLPVLDRPKVSGLLTISHHESAPILPINGLDSGVFTPRKKLYYLKQRSIRPIYICYANESSFSYFKDITIKAFGEFKELLSFGPPDVVQTFNGYKAYRFTADRAIPMKDAWNGYFRIERDSQLGAYSKLLPNPTPKSIKYDVTTNTYISENYVKL